MKRTLFALAVLAFSAHASAQSSATLENRSDSGALAQTGAITFHSSDPLRHTSVSTTPPVYVAPSMFGGASNCGMSDTATLSVTGFGIGGSRSSESDSCNARMDTQTAYNLGFKDVATLRFFCFGEEANRQAYEAAGYQCPGTQAQTVAGYTGNDPIVQARLRGGR